MTGISILGISSTGNSGTSGGSGKCCSKAFTKGWSSVIPAACAMATYFLSSALPRARLNSPSSLNSSARARMISSGVGRSLLVLMLLILAFQLTGCKTTEYVRVSVPVPVECREPEPARPEMPTEVLEPGAAPFVLLRSALAEIDRREAYEIKLRAALAVCTTPIKPSQLDAGVIP